MTLGQVARSALSKQLVFALVGAWLSATPAMAECNYDSRDAVANCKAAAKDYFRKTMNWNTDSYKDVVRRVESLKDTLNECDLNCGMSVVERGADGAFQYYEPDRPSDETYYSLQN